MSSSESALSGRRDQLAEHLRPHLGSIGNLSLTEFAGGASNPTFLLRSDGGQWVLRSKPIGALVSGAHAIDREYRVITALAATGVPVPDTVLYCDDTDVLGAEFYVMEYIEGRVFEDFTLPDVDPAERRAIYDAMNETLAALHAVDPDAVGLLDYGRAGNYFERQIGVWQRQYRRFRDEQGPALPRFEGLVDWLTSNLLDGNRRTIVHGDFRLANLVIAPDAPSVAAVLDWELSTTGDPLADLTYNLSQWYLPNINEAFGKVTLAGADLAALGIPSMEDYADTYADRVDVHIPRRDLYYGIAFNLYRLAGIIIGVMGRTSAGTAKNDFARSSAHNLDPVVELAWHYVAKAEAA